MTPKEIEEVVGLNSRMTLDRAFRPIGLLAGYTNVALEEEPPETEAQRESLLGGIYSSLRTYYDRVNGFYLGVQRTLQVAPPLSVGVKGGYGLSRDKPEYGVNATYEWGRLNDPAIYPTRGFVRVGYDRGLAPQYVSSTYSRLANSITTYVGWPDYFDYYEQDMRFIEAGITSDRLKTTLSFGFSDEEHLNTSRNRDNKGWFFGDRQRDNPDINTGQFTLYKASLSIGDEPEILMRAGGTGINLSVAHQPQKLGLPAFTRYEVRGDLSIPTFYKRRSWPNALHIRAFASTYNRPIARADGKCIRCESPADFSFWWI